VLAVNCFHTGGVYPANSISDEADMGLVDCGVPVV